MSYISSHSVGKEHSGDGSRSEHGYLQEIGALLDLWASPIESRQLIILIRSGERSTRLLLTHASLEIDFITVSELAAYKAEVSWAS